MVRISSKIRRILVDAGLVTVEDWREACKDGGQPVTKLISKEILSEDDLLGNGTLPS